MPYPTGIFWFRLVRSPQVTDRCQCPVLSSESTIDNSLNLDEMSYEERRQTAFDLSTLEERRLMGDMIKISELLRGHDVNMDEFL